MATNFYATSDWKQTYSQVLRRDGYKCQYCGSNADQVDHIVPRHISQDDSEGNLVAVCRPCNKWFGGKHFESYEEKLNYYKKHNLDVWQEYLDRAHKKEMALGRSLTESEKRKGRMVMIAEGKIPIAPHARAFDNRCETCAATASAIEGREQGWPNKAMCPACAKEAGVSLNYIWQMPTRLIDKYEFFIKKEQDSANKRRLELLIKEERAKKHIKDEGEKLQWNIDHADEIEEGMIFRRVCRECGTKTENFKYVDGLPYCEGEHQQESTYLAPNVDWFIEEAPEKKPAWHKVTPEDRKLREATRPESWLPDELVKDTKSREERRAWNIEHADWLELNMPSQRVCRECGRKTGYYDLIEGIVQCVWCQRERKRNG